MNETSMTACQIIEKLKELPPEDQLVVKAFLDQNLAGELTERLYRDFTLLGSDSGCDVSYAVVAQAEVVAEPFNSSEL